MELLETNVYEFILYKIDDLDYDPMKNIIKIEEEDGQKVYKENDFVKEIIEKDREFRQKQIEQGKASPFELVDVDKIEATDRINESSIVNTTIKNDLNQLNNTKLKQVQSLKSKDLEGSQVSKSKVSAMADSKEPTLEENNSKKKGDYLFVDNKQPKFPDKPNKAQVKIPKGTEVRGQLKKDKDAKIMALNAEEYGKYQGKDQGLRFEDEKKKLTPEEAMQNEISHYMNDREKYDGKFNEDEEGKDVGFKRYEKIYVRI